MSNARWIWCKGDFELYHSIQLHSRREELGVEYPVMWALYPPFPNVVFRKKFNARRAGSFQVSVKGKAYIRVDGEKYAPETEIPFTAGEHDIEIPVLCADGTFPCVFIDSEELITDESWICVHASTEKYPVGTMEEYCDKNDNPHIFKFSYEPIFPVASERIGKGILYDFGRETFARLQIEKGDKEQTYRLCYGESREEALDAQNAIIRLTLAGQDRYDLDGRAFRFVFLENAADSVKVRANYEYLPLKDRADFTCNNPEIKEIWDVCAHTFHLNSREFFLDGIKRDRWVWSGDAYQSYMANNYLFFDNNITKRTILALLGKPPYAQHVNTINDYTMYLIIAVKEYYQNTGDSKFVAFVWPRICALYGFLAGRTDEKDYVCHRSGDWIFIDWSPMDKSGPLCAEQILYWQTKNAMATLSELVGEDGGNYAAEAEKLKAQILRDYWNEEKGAFIDCHTSGKENVTRHANIFAILYDFVDEDKIQKIYENVLENDAVTPITTPYFEFFELLAYGKLGKIQHIQNKIESYWGGILRLGGTSIWEQFDPNREGIDHYEMYGKKFGCSLCHAWGSGPIYLLGRYCVGVYPTDVGYKTFRVEPNPGKYESFRGTVPLPEGEVQVEYADGKLSVTAGAEGGTLLWQGKEYTLEKDVTLTV